MSNPEFCEIGGEVSLEQLESAMDRVFELVLPGVLDGAGNNSTFVAREEDAEIRLNMLQVMSVPLLEERFWQKDFPPEAKQIVEDTARQAERQEKEKYGRTVRLSPSFYSCTSVNPYYVDYRIFKNPSKIKALKILGDISSFTGSASERLVRIFSVGRGVIYSSETISTFSRGTEGYAWRFGFGIHGDGRWDFIIGENTFQPHPSQFKREPMQFLADEMRHFLNMWDFYNPFATSRFTRSRAGGEPPASSKTHGLNLINVIDSLRSEEDLFRFIYIQEQQRDWIRYELERRSREDPSFIWPSWIPREDAHGPIRSRRGMLDQSYGSSPRFDSDPYYDEQRFRDDLDRYFPSGDHASGAGRD